MNALAALGLWWPLGATATVDFNGIASAPIEYRVQQKLEKFSGFTSRVVGYAGAKQSADFIQREFSSLRLDDIAVHEFDVTVPIEKSGNLQVIESDLSI